MDDKGPMTASEVRRRQLEWGAKLAESLAKARRVVAVEDKITLHAAMAEQITNRIEAAENG